MSQVPSASTSTTKSTTNFDTIFTAALKEYKKQTKRDISSHPLAAQLQSCDSPSAILAVLQARVQKFDQSQSDDEKWIKWVDPTVNVLFAFSATLGSGVGLVIARYYLPKIYHLMCVTIGIPTCKRGFHWDRGTSPSEHLFDPSNVF